MDWKKNSQVLRKSQHQSKKWHVLETVNKLVIIAFLVTCFFKGTLRNKARINNINFDSCMSCFVSKSWPVFCFSTFGSLEVIFPVTFTLWQFYLSSLKINDLLKTKLEMENVKYCRAWLISPKLMRLSVRLFCSAYPYVYVGKILSWKTVPLGR